MLKRNDQHSWEIVGHPCLVEIRILAESQRRGSRKMALLIEHRIRNGFTIVVSRQQRRGTEIDGPSPEPGQHWALKLEAFGVRSVRRKRNWRDHIARVQLDDGTGLRIDRDALDVAVQIAGRYLELLPLPLIVVHPNGVPVGPLEFGVDINETLNEVLAGGQIAEA